MNLKKIGLISGTSLIVLVLIGATVLLILGLRELSKVGRDVNAEKGRHDGLYGLNPFPSPSNIEGEKQNVAKLEDWHTRLIAELSRGQAESAEKSPGEFNKMLARKQVELVAFGEKGAVAKDFGFGFEAYFTTGAQLAPPEFVPRLTEQLMIVDRLVKIVLSQKVVALTAIRREQFEIGETMGGGGGGGGRGKYSAPGSATPAAALTGTQPGVLGPNDQFAKYHFTMEFKAYETNLWTVLNSLASDSMFIVVTSVSFSKDRPDVSEREGATAAAAVNVTPAAEKVAGRSTNAPADTVKQVPPAEERIVCGPELQQPVQVVLELDVYKFRKKEQ